MSFTIPIKEMSFEEKMQTMEIIWDDLCHSKNSIDSPSWHKDILIDRERELKEGTEELVDWDAAKRLIKKKLNEDKNIFFC